jgi:hypothetical protein
MRVVPKEPWRGGQVCGEQIHYGAVALPLGTWSSFCGEIKAPGEILCPAHHQGSVEQYGVNRKIAPGNAVGDLSERELLLWEREDGGWEIPSKEDQEAWREGRYTVPDEEEPPQCEGHYDDDRALLIGGPYYCNGKCLPVGKSSTERNELIMTLSETGSSLPPRLTDEERAVLKDWADAEGHPREGWQVFDETNSTEDNYAEVKTGPLHATCDEAEAFGKSSGLGAWTVIPHDAVCHPGPEGLVSGRAVPGSQLVLGPGGGPRGMGGTSPVSGRLLPVLGRWRKGKSWRVCPAGDHRPDDRGGHLVPWPWCPGDVAGPLSGRVEHRGGRRGGRQRGARSYVRHAHVPDGTAPGKRPVAVRVRDCRPDLQLDVFKP